MKTNSDFPQFASLAKLLHFPKDSHQKKFFLAKIEGFVDQFVRFLDIVDDEVTAGDREDARLVEEGKVNEVEGLVMTGGIWSGKEGLGGGRGSREGMRLREKRR